MKQLRHIVHIRPINVYDSLNSSITLTSEKYIVLTIFVSSSLASATLSLSLLSTTKIRP